MTQVFKLPQKETKNNPNNQTSYPEDKKILELKNIAKKNKYRNPTLLEKYLYDKYELVRIEAVETLKEYVTLEAKQILEKKLDDVSELVRAYAAHSLSFIGDSRSMQKIKGRLKKEYSDRTKLDLFNALYVLSDYKDKYLYQLCNLLNSNNRNARIAVGNTIKGHIGEDDISFISVKLCERYKVENNYEVKKSLWKNIKIVLRYNSLILKNQFKFDTKDLKEPTKPKPIALKFDSPT